jgi:hypothetical protein
MEVQTAAVSDLEIIYRPPAPVNLARYANLHKWMIIPMLVMQLGIFVDYWGDFSANAWSVHVHYVVATLWYFYLIVQPYYATHGLLKKHRTNGIIGVFLAGGVAMTAISMLHRDMVSAQLAVNFIMFGPWFFYGVAVIEIVMMSAFIYAVLQGILHRKEVENHSWWLMSSVFIIMMPALGRGLQNLWVAIAGASPNTDIMMPLYISVLVIIGLTLWTARRYGRINHPATYVAVGANLLVFALVPIGKSASVQAFLRALIKG